MLLRKQIFVVFSVLVLICVTEGRKSKVQKGFGNDLVVSNSSAFGRQGKFFGFVNFPSNLCQGENGQNDKMGVCMKRSHCTTAGGQDIGNCAQTFGVCCLVSQSCSSDTVVVTQNGSHLTHSPSYEPLCRYEFPRPTGVCQIRLDFTTFNIDDGTSNIFGVCDTDTLTVSGNSNGMLGALCGNLDGQHMFLEYGSNDKLNLDIFMPNDMNQMWNILVTQIKCDSSERAPPGCLQYYTTPRGTVKSFNFNNMHQLNDQDYAVCVRNVPGMKKITWKTCGGDNDFVLTTQKPAISLPGQPPAPPLGNQWSGDQCMYDWVMIFGDNKYCGSIFPATSVSMTQPFIMQVHMDHWELPIPPNLQPADDENTGFCLMYGQTPF